MYYKGEGVQQDFEKAFYWWEKAESQGNLNAERNIKQSQILFEEELKLKKKPGFISFLKKIIG